MTHLTGLPVVSIEYHLAPEHPFPEGLEETIFVIEWLKKNGKKFSLRTNKIFLLGDSAGANLALSASLKMIEAQKEEKEQVHDGMVLIYPSVSIQKRLPSTFKFARDILLPEESRKIFSDCYISHLKEFDHFVSPLYAPDHLMSKLPPCMIVCGDRDPLLDDSLELESRLKKLGVRVELKVHEGLTHGYVAMETRIKEARNSIDLMAKWINKMKI